MITGPSKTGKTTLYKQVLQNRQEQALVVQCTAERTCDEIWKVALESVNFDRVIQTNNGRSNEKNAEFDAGVTFGWKWLAGVTGVLKGSITANTSDGEIRERMLGQPSPDLLIPVLKSTNYVLVIEDFHYLDDRQKILLFQQWKRFIDNEISIIVLGTTHRAVDIANSNRDLLGRISQIDVGHWNENDLIKICNEGFRFLKTDVNQAVKRKICEEAVGLPIIVQQACLQLYSSRSIFNVAEARKRKIKFTEDSVMQALHEVANEKYAQFESYYATLIRGPREKKSRI